MMDETFACRALMQRLTGDPMAGSDHHMEKGGLPAAIGAYLIWGLLPLYLMLVSEVPPIEFVGWRIIWTVPVCLLIVLARRQLPAILSALTDLKAVLVLAASAALIGLNWIIYVWAIHNGQVFAASLGYYINPILNIVLGTVVLKERLSRLQWGAVILAALAVSLLLAGAISTLWISLSLALTFALYGLLRKQIAVGALPGLTIEAALLAPAASALLWYHGVNAETWFDKDLNLRILIMLGGVITAIPLLLFAIAARKMPYSTLGFVQYLTPSMVFLAGLLVFEEELRPVQLACFVLIWTAVALFIGDLRSRSKRSP